MKYLKEIHLWSENGIAYDEIVERLSERSDDECYSAYHWLENITAKRGLPPMFPDVAFRPGRHTDPKLLLSFVVFPDEIPAVAREMVAMAAEHLSRESRRKLFIG